MELRKRDTANVLEQERGTQKVFVDYITVIVR